MSIEKLMFDATSAAGQARDPACVSRFSFSHLGVAVPTMERAVDEYAAVFGYRVLSGLFEDPIQRVRVCFLGRDADDRFQIELVAPLDAGSPVTRFIAKGIASYHTCYDVEDIDEALEFVRAQGCFV